MNRTVGDKYDVNGGDLFTSLTELIQHYKVGFYIDLY